MEWAELTRWGTTNMIGVITFGALGSLLGAVVWALGRIFYARKLLPFHAEMEKQSVADAYEAWCIEGYALRDPVLAVTYVGYVSTRATFHAIFGATCYIAAAVLITAVKSTAIPTLLASVGSCAIIFAKEQRERLEGLMKGATEQIRNAAAQEFMRSWAEEKAAPKTIVRLDAATRLTSPTAPLEDRAQQPRQEGGDRPQSG